jgi:nitrite reductase/ring-hydroxylating ferredoxin subunit
VLRTTASLVKNPLHDGSVHALGNIDPFYGAPVICHGIVGDRSGVPTVASPLGKQVFCLRTGRRLDSPDVTLPVFRVAVRDGVIRRSTPGNADEHAVEAAIARLRSSLGAPKVVQTVVKRGYRLALAI